MQSILPTTTSMKTFTIVLPVVTVSTILAVLLLTVSFKDVQQTISKNVPNPTQRLRTHINSHLRKTWGKESSRSPGEHGSVWKYITVLAELCLIRIPVHEVKEAANLYGLCKQRPEPESSKNNLGRTISQTHLRSATTLVSDGGPDVGDGTANTKSRVRQVREQLEIQQTQQAEHKSILAIIRQVPTILFIGIRILLLGLWIPLLLLEYIVLLFCCPLLGGRAEPMQVELDMRLGSRVNRRWQLKRLFIAPFLFLGLDLDSHLHSFRVSFSPRSWRWRSPMRRARHEHRSPRPPPPPPPTAGSYDHALASLPPPSSPYRHQIAVNRPPGRGAHVRSASRIRQVMAQPNFQAASAYQYQSQQHQQHLHISGPSPHQGVHGHTNNPSPCPRGSSARPGGVV
jgi:hypothetical protein